MQIVAQLEDMMKDMSPGDQIPSRREMMQVFGVCEHTVHKALYYLLGKGLLEIRRDGVFVAGGMR
jgi:DNA-binding GntR family transcriptional regulator